MNRTFIMAALLVLIVAGVAVAQTVQYTCGTVSVDSASTPRQVLTVGQKTAWSINERAANPSATPAAANILVFPYAGPTIPAAAPSACASPTTTLVNSGCYEVTPTKPLSDSVACDNPSCRGDIGSAWAAILESGSTAVTTDGCFR